MCGLWEGGGSGGGDACRVMRSTDAKDNRQTIDNILPWVSH